MIGAFDTTSSLTQTDFYVVYIFSVCQLIGIFFLIRHALFCLQVVSDNSSSESTSPTTNNDKKSKGRTGWPQHVWASELKNWREEKKKKTGWTELLETGRSAVMRMRVSDPCDTVSESDVWEPNAVIKFSHVKRTF